MKYDLDAIVDRNGTNSVKWEFMQMLDPDVGEGTLPFWVADMDFACAKPVTDALHARIDRSIFGYSINYTGEYYRAVCGWYQHRFGWYVNSSDIVFSPGVVPAFNYLVDILSEPGEGVIIQTPVYYPFAGAIKSHGRVIVENPLIKKEGGYYEMDYEDLERKAVESKVKLLIFCSPHNPVGRVWTEAELKKLGEVCARHGITIISDEIHYDLVRMNVVHRPLETVIPEYRDRIVTCTAPSKSFNLAGMQISNIVIHDKAIRAKWDAYMGKLSIMGPTALSIVATQAAYYEGEEWLDQVREYIDGNAAFVERFLKERLPKAVYHIPEGTYLIWIDLSAYGGTSEELVKRFMRESKVLIEAGTMFGAQAEGYVRINIACPRSLLKEAFNRMANTLNKLVSGNMAPDFTYETPWEKDLRFSETVKKGPVFLMFLRYYGCTMCQLEMHKLAKDYAKIAATGAKVLVVLQSAPQGIRDQIKKGDLPFEIVCDPEKKLFDLYDVRPAIHESELFSPALLVAAAEAMALGLKHGAYEGDEKQLPALFFIKKDLSIGYARYARNLGDLPSHGEMVELVK